MLQPVTATVQWVLRAAVTATVQCLLQPVTATVQRVLRAAACDGYSAVVLRAAACDSYRAVGAACCSM